MKHCGLICIGWAIALLAVFGFIAPALVSSANTGLVILGFVVVAIALGGTVAAVNKMATKSDEENSDQPVSPKSQNAPTSK
jgi:hypothetical protein